MKSNLLGAFLAIFMASTFVTSAHAGEYFHADKKARLYNEISSFKAMRNELTLSNLNRGSNTFGFAVTFLDKKPDNKHNDKVFARFMKTNPGKKNYFIVLVGPDMHAIYKASSPTAERLAKKIIERSTYDEKVLAGPLVSNTVETMKHR
jgi:hypothetical protein